ncbi:MAG: RluA family pseudouridine synthase [Fimbriimonadaceae bacterium]|nr:RluA family pseudouridine synthase [Fimbriimonadaceae bacterium]
MRFEADAAERLDKFLARVLPQHSRTRLKKVIEEGGVLVDGVVRLPAHKLDAGMVVEIGEVPPTPPHDAEPFAMDLRVLYEDDFLLVIDKPRGLAVHPTRSQKAPTLVNALLARPHSLSTAGGGYRPGIVHRLDKETTGLIVVAKTDGAHVLLAKQFAAKTAERRYVAAVKGCPAEERFTVNAPIGRDPHSPIKMVVLEGGKDAVTHVRLLRRLDQGALVGCRLETGRTHQIRVHLAAVGHPVLGDHLYAPREYRDGPMQLHAALLRFVHPATGETLSFFTPAPEDFLAPDFLESDLADL